MNNEPLLETEQKSERQFPVLPEDNYNVFYWARLEVQQPTITAIMHGY